MDIDYRTARIDLLSGALIEGLVVQSPPSVRSFAPDLAEIGHLDVRRSLHSLLGRAPMIEQVAIADVTIAAVVDEQGTTSFDLLVPQDSSPSPATPVPLSKKAAQIFAGAPPIGELSIDRVSFVMVQTANGQMSNWTELRGAGLTLGTATTANGWTARGASAYLSHRDSRDPLASPLYADLSDLLPIQIHVGTLEVLFDDSTIRRALPRA